ncbi:MAG: 2-phospho-L-lactate guanylyltransferase [Polyangiales bacterium]
MSEPAAAATSMDARSCVLVPMKPFALAKSRLRAHLSDAAREQLARTMLERVLDAARGCELVDATYVITSGDDVARLARSAQLQVLHDPRPAPLTLGHLIDHGLRQLAVRGVTRAVVLMADLPHLTSADVRELCVALATSELVISPDRHGRSTNALGVQLPLPVATAFGAADSFDQHVALAHTRQWRLHALHNPRIAHDVDVPADLAGAGLPQP